MYNVPNEHIPSDEDLESLAEGDQEIVNILIEGLTSFILNEMDWFIKDNPILAGHEDDIKGKAILTLVETVNALLGHEKFTPSQFMNYVNTVCTRSVIKATMQQQLPVSVPEGSLLNPVIREKLNNIRDNTRGVQEDDKQTGNDLLGEIWFDDFMNNLPETDAMIIRMRINGCSLEEIGTKIGRHHSQVSIRLQKILGDLLSE